MYLRKKPFFYFYIFSLNNLDLVYLHLDTYRFKNYFWLQIILENKIKQNEYFIQDKNFKNVYFILLIFENIFLYKLNYFSLIKYKTDIFLNDTVIIENVFIYFKLNPNCFSINYFTITSDNICFFMNNIFISKKNNIKFNLKKRRIA